MKSCSKLTWRAYSEEKICFESLCKADTYKVSIPQKTKMSSYWIPAILQSHCLPWVPAVCPVMHWRLKESSGAGRVGVCQGDEGDTGTPHGACSKGTDKWRTCPFHSAGSQMVPGTCERKFLCLPAWEVAELAFKRVHSGHAAWV